MTNPAPVEPFNGKPANNLQGTDMSPAQAYRMTNLDKQIHGILESLAYDYTDGATYYASEKEIQSDISEATKTIKALIATQIQEARESEITEFVIGDKLKQEGYEYAKKRMAQLRSTK